MFARAADVARQGNALALAIARRRGRAYLPAEHQRFVDGLIQACGPEFFGRLAGAGLATARPVFIVGLPRSGTTLVEQVLASHSRVYGAGELRLVRLTFEAIPEMMGRSETPLACLPELDPAAARRWPSGIWKNCAGWTRAAAIASWTRCRTTTCTWGWWRPCSPRPW